MQKGPPVPTGPDAIEPLLRSLRAGNRDALADLFDIYRGQLRCMIDLRLDPRLAGRMSCSDVIQETYIEALKRVEHFLDKPEMPFYLWLRMVASQRLIDVHREHFGAAMRDVQREVAMDGGASPSASSYSLAARLAGRGDSPSQAAVKNETLAQLEAALEQMDPLDREVLALRHFEELTNDEVARLLNLKKSAASNRYVRALKRLRELLGAGASDSADTDARIV